jgi:putative ABC transport system ATP-binding protein
MAAQAQGAPAARATIISLQGVSRTYRLGSVEVPALVDISLDVADGEFVAIVGPSGSGKTTMMNILGCLDRPTSGRYLFDSVPVASLSDDQLALVRSRSIGFVFQNYSLLSRTTALDNVAAPLLYQGVRAAERHGRAQAALERVGLADRIHHQPSELSGGQELNASGRTVVLITHEEAVADAADRKISLHDGRVAA